MKKNYFSFLLISFLLATFTASGEEVINLTTQDKSYTIDKQGTYHFTTAGNQWLYDIIVTTQDHVDIILEDVNIKSDVPLNLYQAKDVTVELIGENILDNSEQHSSYAAVTAPYCEGGKLIFSDKSSGSLKAISYSGAGIGWLYISSYNTNSTKIIINGGDITAISNEGNGIGGPSNPASLTSTKGTIIITGGTIRAISTSNIGIGISKSSDDYGIFKTSEDDKSGNAFILTNSLIGMLPDDQLSGIIFQGNVGKVYGTPTLQTNAIIPEGTTLTINDGQTLTVKEGITLTNEGTIDNNGTINNNGTIDFEKGALIDNGKIIGGTALHKVKLIFKEWNSNYFIEGITIDVITNYEMEEKLIATITSDASGSAVFSNILHNREYKFKVSSGYDYIKYISLNNDNVLSTNWGKLNEDKEITFEIKINDFIVSNKKFNITYGNDFNDLDLNTLVEKAEEDKEFEPVRFAIIEGSLLDGLSFDQYTYIISGKPKAATIGDKEVKIKVAGNKFESIRKDLLLIFNITPRELIINLPQNEVLYKDEVDTYNPDISFENTVTNEIPAYKYENIKGTDGLFYYKTIKLVDNDAFIASNYTIKDQDKYKIKLIEANAIDQKATITGNYNDITHWYTSAVTLKAPEGFTISSSNIRLLSDPQQEITIDKGGQYQYILKRDYSNLEIKGDINIDIIPPFITLSQDNLDFELTVSDEMSGIDKVLLDGTLITLTDNTYNGHSTAGSHTIEVFDVAGNKTTMSFTLEKKDDDPYVPPYEPDPVITYTVTLPAVEGITTDPVAGDYSVEEYSSFSFTVTVAEGYREQSVPVVKVNGSVFEPADTDGHYKIKFIRSDQSIIVEGILADTPTANETLGTPAFELRTEGHTLCITLPKPSLCRLFDPSGRLICSRQLTPGINRLEGLAAGIYFVVVEREGVRKIVVQ